MRTGAGAPTVGLLAVVLLAGMSLPAESADLQLKEAIRSGDHADGPRPDRAAAPT